MVVGNVNPSGREMNGQVYGRNIAPTLTTNKGEGVKIVEPLICASRGRNSSNLKSRKSELETVQTLEIKYDDTANTLTTVRKDNYVIEPVIKQKSRGYNNGGIHILSPPITSSSWQENNHLLIHEATEQGYAIAIEGDSVNLEHPNSKTRRGWVGKGVVNALTTSCNQGVVEAEGLYLNDSPAFFRGSI